jgi:hypothetical protein
MFVAGILHVDRSGQLCNYGPLREQQAMPLMPLEADHVRASGDMATGTGVDNRPLAIARGENRMFFLIFF